jgi:hypothetical protein
MLSSLLRYKEILLKELRAFMDIHAPKTEIK